jgi:thymidylate synthase
MEKESILFAKMKMVDNFKFTLLDPTQSLINLRKNWAWALHEGINRLSFEDGSLQNPGTAYKYRPNWKRKLEKEGGKFCYSYGQEYRAQVPAVIQKLRSKSEREAVITMWNNYYLDRDISKTKPRRPCTLTLHFYFFNGKLNCACNMRTVDVMNMLPYDVFHHTLLQRYIASVLKVDIGVFHFIASFAYYQKKRDETKSVLNTIAKLEDSTIPEVEEDWLFTDDDRKELMGLTRRINDESMFEEGFQPQDLTLYGTQYAKALLYLYKLKRLKLKQPIKLKEFEVIYK